MGDGIRTSLNQIAKKTYCVVILLCFSSSMWPVSLDCFFLLPLRYSLTFICQMIIVSSHISYDYKELE